MGTPQAGQFLAALARLTTPTPVLLSSPERPSGSATAVRCTFVYDTAATCSTAPLQLASLLGVRPLPGELAELADGTLTTTAGKLDVEFRVGSFKAPVGLLLLREARHHLLSGPALNLLGFRASQSGSSLVLHAPSLDALQLHFDAAARLWTVDLVLSVDQAGSVVLMRAGPALQLVAAVSEPSTAAPAPGESRSTSCMHRHPLPRTALAQHLALGHPDDATLKRTLPAVDGLRLIPSPRPFSCPGCLTGVHRRRAIPSSAPAARHVQYRPGEAFNVDFTRMFAEADLEGHRLGVVYTDVATGYDVVDLLVDHPDVVRSLPRLQRLARTVAGGELRALFGDADRVWTTSPAWSAHRTAVQRWCDDAGITFTTTAGYAPQSNGLVESHMGVLLSIVNKSIMAAHVSPKFWGRGLAYAAAVVNRRVRRTERPLARGLTPAEAFTGVRPDLSVFIAPPFATAYVKVQHTKPSSLAPQSRMGIYLGPAEFQRGWLVLLLDTMKITVSYHIKVDPDLSRRPGLLLQRRELLSRTGAASPSARLFLDNLDSLFASSSPGALHDQVLLIDELTGIPVALATSDTDLVDYVAVRPTGAPRGSGVGLPADPLPDALTAPSVPAPDPPTSAAPAAPADGPPTSAAPAAPADGMRLHNRPLGVVHPLTSAEKAEVRALPGSTAIQFQPGNPKTAGSTSWKRYESYRTAATIDQYKSLVGRSQRRFLWADLYWDLARGFARLPHLTHEAGNLLSTLLLATCHHRAPRATHGTLGGGSVVSAPPLTACVASPASNPGQDVARQGSSLPPASRLEPRTCPDLLNPQIAEATRKVTVPDLEEDEVDEHVHGLLHHLCTVLDDQDGSDRGDLHPGDVTPLTAGTAKPMAARSPASLGARPVKSPSAAHGQHLLAPVSTPPPSPSLPQHHDPATAREALSGRFGPAAG